jgi:thiamine transport system permease protein
MDPELDTNRTALIRRWLWLALPLAFLAAFFLYPLGAILNLSLVEDGRLTLDGVREVATGSYYWDTLIFTIWQAALSTALTLAAALPSAYVFTRFKFPGKSLLMSLATLPFVLPTVVVAIAFDALLGSRGLLNAGLMGLFGLDDPPLALERSLTAILIAHVFYNYALALRMIAGYWANQSVSLEEAARVLGARGWRLWWHVRLPLLRPAVTAAALLVFIFTFTSFGVILILGGLRFATLEVEIYQQAVNLFDLPTAATLSLVQIGLMFAMMIVYTRLQRRTAADLRRAAAVERRPRTVREHAYVIALVLFMAVMLFAPLLALVLRSFTAGAGLENYANLWRNPRGSISFVPPMTAVANSVFFAGATTVLSLLLGTLTAYGIARGGRLARLADPLFMLPLATSAVTLGFGYLLTWNRSIPTLILIPLVHSLVALPFVVRSVLPALLAIPPRLIESARVLGADSRQVWRLVELPLIGRALAVGATFAFTISMGEFGASLFLARPDTPTMPVVIFRLFNQPGAANYGQSLALSAILLLVCATSFVLIERLRTAGVGEF